MPLPKNMLLPEFTKHVALPGETFASLSQQLGIHDPVFLRLFHNECCQIKELLGPEFKEGQIIYLPLQEEIVTINARAALHLATSIENARKVHLAPDRTLPFYPVKINNRYEVTIELDTENIPQEIHYIVEVKWLKQLDNANILYINQSGYLYNGEEPESKMDTLACQCTQSLFPLAVAVNNQCHFLGVANAVAIRSRWNENKPGIRHYFSDSYSHQYIAEMDKALQNPEAMNAMLRKNLFFTILFPSLYETPFTQHLSAVENSNIPIITGSPPLLFEITNTLEEYISPSNTIIVNQSGYSIDLMPLEDTYLKIQDNYPDDTENEPIVASNTIRYQLERDTFYIHKVNATYTVMLPSGERNIHITMKKITV
jgi:hypothetical protein